MTLPTLNTPIYSTKIPSTGKDIKYRPFLVKEEKIILIAIQSKDNKTISNTVKELISNCTFNKINVDTLTSFDIEFLFLQLRIKSKGNKVSLTYTCKNRIENDPDGLPEHVCNHQNAFEIDLDTVTVFTPPEHNKKIMVTDTVGIIMKYPSLEEISNYDEKIKNSSEEEKINHMYELIQTCISEIFDGEEISSGYTKEELKDWVEGLDSDTFEKINNFFSTMPTLKKSVNMKCSKCGFEELVDIEGLQNFLE